MEAALQRWELSELGTESFSSNPEQQRMRMDGRSALATELTEALGTAGPRLAWERERAAYYALRNGIPQVAEGANEADLAILEMGIVAESGGSTPLEDSLAFNLWKNPEEGWRIIGLYKGLSMLRPFLDNVRKSE